jgi:hypothetical protein
MKKMTMKRLKYFIPLIIFAGLLSSGCRQANKQAASTSRPSIAVADSTLSTACPYLSHDTAGSPVLSWIQQKKDSGTPLVYYAVFQDSSKTFGKPRAVPSTAGVEQHGEDMPKIIFRKNWGILVVFSIKKPHPGNPYTAAVYYTGSSDGGAHWTPARPLIKDSTKSFDQRYFDVAPLPGGAVGIVWLNNSEPSGSTLYFATMKGNKGFEGEKIIGRHTCQCCRTDLLVDDSGRIHVAWRDIFRDSIRDMAYCYSNDSGKTFSAPVRISPDNWVVNGCPHTGPSMAVNKVGLHFSWFTMGGGGGVYYCHTDNNGISFSMRQPVSQVPSARHPQMAALPKGDLAIVWDEGVTSRDAFHQRVGLQMRGPGGLLLGTRYLTPDSLNAGFPQIRVLDEREALVAYTMYAKNRTQVRYRVIRLQP